MTAREVDPGAQNERTVLAWHRTALSLLTAALVLARLNFDRIGTVGFGSVVAGLAMTGWLFVASRARYEQRARGRGATYPGGGVACMALTALFLVLAATELAAMLAPR